MTEVQHLRRALETTIEMLIAYLDEIDGNPDLEDTDEDVAVDDTRCDESDSGDDEPWLGGGLMGDDRELDDEREPEDGI